MRCTHLALALVLVTAGARQVRADCAEPPGYDVTQTGGSVDISVRFSGCSSSLTLLRQDVASGAVLELAPYCNQAGHYEDDCVPAGSYRYGLAKPLTCGGCGSTAEYFAPVTVSSSGDAGCTLAPGNAAPQTYSSAPPWPPDGGNSVCPGGGGCSCSTSASVLTFDGLVFALALRWRVQRRRRV